MELSGNTIPLSRIKPNPENPRVIHDDKFKKLCKSLKDFPQMMEKRPIVVDENWMILGGNMRFRALKENGLKAIPVEWVSIAEGWTDAQKKEFVIKDNAGFGEWDWNTLANWDVPLADWGVDVPDWNADGAGGSSEAKEDDFDESEATEGRCSKGDIWQLGNHRLMCGDSTNAADVALLMDGNKADMVFTDPPYNVNYADKNKFLNEADKGNRIQADIENDANDTDEEAGEKLWKPAFLNMIQNAEEHCSIYVTMPQGGAHMMMMMMMMRDAGWRVKHELIWNKNNHVLGRTDYFYKHEPICFGWNKKHKFYGKGKFDKSVWDIPKPQKSDLRPTMKPIELIENALLNSSTENDSILDLFGGSGSTLIAAEQLNRKCYMMELDPHYCDVILARWEKLTGREAVKIG